ncbi:hypothetical protein T265_14771 [Opisthorchis viverrini]|uniref:Uncharacterized protein n=1 Tax=Opisthorchis viverrini TaxID=6198 RepID=A0A075A5W7_OPIVI|nr:hypothetical protein T265_14771 [Opisthorchis viverrini]KER22834.1 hypothetical protein T265_14771 [Opisthorchis viverrini]
MDSCAALHNVMTTPLFEAASVSQQLAMMQSLLMKLIDRLTKSELKEDLHSLNKTGFHDIQLPQANIFNRQLKQELYKLGGRLSFIDSNTKSEESTKKEPNIHPLEACTGHTKSMSGSTSFVSQMSTQKVSIPPRGLTATKFTPLMSDQYLQQNALVLHDPTAAKAPNVVSWLPINEIHNFGDSVHLTSQLIQKPPEQVVPTQLLKKPSLEIDTRQDILVASVTSVSTKPSKKIRPSVQEHRQHQPLRERRSSTPMQAPPSSQSVLRNHSSGSRHARDIQPEVQQHVAGKTKHTTSRPSFFNRPMVYRPPSQCDAISDRHVIYPCERYGTRSARSVDAVSTYCNARGQSDKLTTYQADYTGDQWQRPVICQAIQSVHPSPCSSSWHREIRQIVHVPCVERSTCRTLAHYLPPTLVEPWLDDSRLALKGERRGKDLRTYMVSPLDNSCTASVRQCADGSFVVNDTLAAGLTRPLCARRLPRLLGCAPPTEVMIPAVPTHEVTRARLFGPIFPDDLCGPDVVIEEIVCRYPIQPWIRSLDIRINSPIDAFFIPACFQSPPEICLCRSHCIPTITAICEDNSTWRHFTTEKTQSSRGSVSAAKPSENANISIRPAQKILESTSLVRFPPSVSPEVPRRKPSGKTESKTESRENIGSSSTPNPSQISDVVIDVDYQESVEQDIPHLKIRSTSSTQATSSSSVPATLDGHISRKSTEKSSSRRIPARRPGKDQYYTTSQSPSRPATNICKCNLEDGGMTCTRSIDFNSRAKLSQIVLNFRNCDCPPPHSQKSDDAVKSEVNGNLCPCTPEDLELHPEEISSNCVCHVFKKLKRVLSLTKDRLSCHVTDRQFHVNSGYLQAGIPMEALVNSEPCGCTLSDRERHPEKFPAECQCHADSLPSSSTYTLMETTTSKKTTMTRKHSRLTFLDKQHPLCICGENPEDYSLCGCTMIANTGPSEKSGEEVCSCGCVTSYDSGRNKRVPHKPRGRLRKPGAWSFYLPETKGWSAFSDSTELSYCDCPRTGESSPPCRRGSYVGQQVKDHQESNSGPQYDGSSPNVLFPLNPTNPYTEEEVESMTTLQMDTYEVDLFNAATRPKHNGDASIEVMDVTVNIRTTQEDVSDHRVPSSRESSVVPTIQPRKQSSSLDQKRQKDQHTHGPRAASSTESIMFETDSGVKLSISESGHGLGPQRQTQNKDIGCGSKHSKNFTPNSSSPGKAEKECQPKIQPQISLQCREAPNDCYFTDEQRNCPGPFVEVSAVPRGTYKIHVSTKKFSGACGHSETVSKEHLLHETEVSTNLNTSPPQTAPERCPGSVKKESSG